MPQIGPAEILVVLLVGLLVFGPKRLPEIGRQVGRAMREVKKFQDTVKGELDQVLHFDDHDDAPADSTKNEMPISTVEVPPALPVPEEPPVTPVRPASHAPSRFRAPGPNPTA
jgi:Tat protein translocase TatB subunit